LNFRGPVIFTVNISAFKSWVLKRSINQKLHSHGKNFITCLNVRNETGEPAAFATVRIKSAHSAVSADKEGDYTISVSGGSTLQLVPQVFAMREVGVGNQSIQSISRL
jgi:hypothetical protein